MTTKEKTTTPSRRRRGEGSIARFHRAENGCPPADESGERPAHTCTAPYRARVWVTTMTGGRTRKTLYGRTEGEVLTKLKKATAQEVNGTLVGSSVTLKDWLRTDAAEHGLENWWTATVDSLKVNTRKGYRSKINLYLIPHLGAHRLDRLTPEHVEKMYRAMRKQGLSEGSLLQTHAILKRALKIAMRKGKVARNVCELVDNPPSVAGRKPTPALTVEEAWKVLRVAGDNPRYWLALMEGVRQGEALALRWSDVVLDVPEGQVPFLVVRESLAWEPGVGAVFDTPKSEASTDRVVPLLPMVVARLKVLRATAFASGAKDTDLVFPNPRTGGPMDARVDWAGWKALLDVAGVKDVTLHSARNTTAQLLENAGVPDRVVADILGHATVTMTHRYQSGNSPAKQQAVLALAAWLAESMPPELEGPAA